MSITGCEIDSVRSFSEIQPMNRCRSATCTGVDQCSISPFRRKQGSTGTCIVEILPPYHHIGHATACARSVAREGQPHLGNRNVPRRYDQQMEQHKRQDAALGRRARSMETKNVSCWPELDRRAGQGAAMVSISRSSSSRLMILLS